MSKSNMNLILQKENSALRDEIFNLRAKIRVLEEESEEQKKKLKEEIVQKAELRKKLDELNAS